MGDEHGHKADCFAQLEMLGGCLMNQDFILVVAFFGLHTLQSVMGGREDDQKMFVLSQLAILDPVIDRIIPMCSFNQDSPGVPEVRESEEFFFPRLEDIENHKNLRVFNICNDPVPFVSHVGIDEPRPAVIEVWQGKEIDFLSADDPVGAGVVEKVEETLSGDSILDTVTELPLLLSHPDLLRTHTQPVVEVILAVGPERTAGHIIPVAAVMEKH